MCIICTSPQSLWDGHAVLDGSRDQADCWSNDPAKLSRFSDSSTSVARICAFAWKISLDVDRPMLTNRGVYCFPHLPDGGPSCLCISDNCNTIGSITRGTNGQLLPSSVPATIYGSSPSGSGSPSALAPSTGNGSTNSDTDTDPNAEPNAAGSALAGSAADSKPADGAGSSAAANGRGRA
ncbi:hypothetical protein RvY_13427 [Ramazzottius varieornatus]|uniref:Uncharacterized protein n=1 Tax=Ramazzottius varieornatus TaxID=947166 RepID=A0A1D1VMV3_RAMVA|nr:hypothetical protein RvY_13427 [Ramazzottius varieornatus]